MTIVICSSETSRTGRRSCIGGPRVRQGTTFLTLSGDRPRRGSRRSPSGRGRGGAGPGGGSGGTALTGGPGGAGGASPGAAGGNGADGTVFSGTPPWGEAG